MNPELVETYLAALQAAVGDDDRFMPIFTALKNDKAVRQAEAVALAGRLVFELAPSTPRSKALDRILQRHKDLRIFRLKQLATGGRSAA